MIKIPIHWRSAIYAGIVAGVISSLVQIILWWTFWDALPWTLYRDINLTAAIIMGPKILTSPLAFDWVQFWIATLIHFSLSIIYSVILVWLISRHTFQRSLLLGIVYGMTLFFINMYGFTAIFPWFAVTRDWITMLSHIVFGFSCAGVYKIMVLKQD